MSKRPRQPILIYHNQELMDELNEMFITIKFHLYTPDNPGSRQKPSYQELDTLMFKLMEILKKESSPMRTRHCNK